MEALTLLTAAVFLPLFPLSLLVERLLGRLDGLPRAGLLVLWPLPGALAVGITEGAPPDWLLGFASMSALFHAWRGLGTPDARDWLGLLALSAWPLLWAATQTAETAVVQALALGLPLAGLSLVLDTVERRFGAAHAALDLRLAAVAPRLAGLVVVAVLAATATPLSPAFFAMLSLVGAQVGEFALASPIMLAVWLLWSWSGARILLALVPGPAGHAPRGQDLTPAGAWPAHLAFVLLAVLGVFVGGRLL